ncbi:hypothetical protein ACFL27_12760 [candidate division CSSED10-310 bacterium]|uniref:Uncharacterized protein n=1 Tax=candidate division CSSED10-310 bacterium TaxID=2855610 RepID=A0ABV6YXZ7_UNCC1
MSTVCPICNKKKGKRKCPLHTIICPTCCGNIRDQDTCPEHCPYYLKGQKFSAKKDIEKSRKKTYHKVEYFQKNSDRLEALFSAIQSAFLDVFSRDDYYNDKIILEGIKRAQDFFGEEHRAQQDTAILLNRVGVIETTVKETIYQYKLEKSDLTTKDIDSTLEWLIFVIRNFIIEGTGIDFVEKLKEALHETDEKVQGRIIT